jgi:phage-related tail protein
MKHTLQRKKPVSILAGLGIQVFAASIIGNVYVQATPIGLNIVNATTIASAIDGQQTLAQNNFCTIENSIQESKVALARSQAQLMQANTNLQEFRSAYDRYNTLVLQGKANHQQLETATSAYNLAQLQKSAAIKGLQHSKAQLETTSSC